MTKIKILGEAGRKFARELELDVESPAEALHAINTLFPTWFEYLQECDARGIGWKVITENPQGLEESMLYAPCSDRLIIAPVVIGRGPIGLILAGTALAGAGYAFGVSFLINIGLAFVFQGLAALLSPTPPRPAEKKQSFLYTGRDYQSSVQGSPVPVVFGETVVVSAPVISYGVSLQPQEFIG